jgi:hypothetical protein
MLGLTLAEFFIARCLSGSYDSWTFDGPKFPAQDDFFGSELFNVASGSRQPPPVPKNYASKAATPIAVPKSHLLAWLWQRAEEEWLMP